MSALAHYFATQEATKRWRAEWENAAARMELAQIKERLAEIDSQHKPLADLVGCEPLSPEYESRRRALYAAALYVVTGRTP